MIKKQRRNSHAGGQLILSTVSVPASQEINVDVRIGRGSVLLPKITIEFPASMGAKSTREKPIHAACLLTKQFNPQIYDFSVKFVILAFANRCIFSFSFFFLFNFISYIHGHRGEKRKK